MFIIIAVACHSSKKIVLASKKNMSSSAGLVILRNYAVNADVRLPEIINYKFIITAEEFHNTFHMTKATPGTAIVPDFNSQFIAAIILQPTERVISIDINKAETDEQNLNIYYTLTDTTSWITYPHTIKTIAAIPKNDSIEQVNFYKDDVKQKTLSVND